MPTYCISSDLHRYKGQPVFAQVRLLATSSTRSHAYCDDFENWQALYGRETILKLILGSVLPLQMAMMEIQKEVDTDPQKEVANEFAKRWPKTREGMSKAFRKNVTIELLRKAMEQYVYSWYGIRWADKLTKKFEKSLLRKIEKINGTTYVTHRVVLCKQLMLTTKRAFLLQNVATMFQDILFTALSHFELNISEKDPTTKKFPWFLTHNIPLDDPALLIQKTCMYLIDRLYYHGLIWYASSLAAATFATMDPFMGSWMACGGLVGQVAGDVIGNLIYTTYPLSSFHYAFTDFKRYIDFK